MSSFDKNVREALGGESGFDPARASAAQTEVFEMFQQKLKRSERRMWLLLYFLMAAGIYALDGFLLQAAGAKGWIGYGLAMLTVVVIMIQKTLLHGMAASQIVTLKELKLLRLSLAGGGAPQDAAAARPLSGISNLERVAWLCGIIAVSAVVGGLGSMSNRQDDVWRLKAQGRIEARSVVTYRRLPHVVASIYGARGPVEGAVLQSAALNGRPVSFDGFKDQYAIHLPGRLALMKDQVELIWSFPLAGLQQSGDFRAPLRAVMPVHGYSLSLYVEDDSGYAGEEDAWKFNKSPEQLKNEAEARRTIKLFTQEINGAAPRDDFGSCGLPIASLAAR